MRPRVSQVPILSSQFDDGVKAILLDFDGTLVDSLSVLKKIYFGFMEQHGVAGYDEEFNELNGPSLPEIIHILKLRYSLKGSESELLAAYLDVVGREYSKNIQAFPGAQNLLVDLLQVRLPALLVTSTAKKLVTPFLMARGWHKYFQHIITGDMVAQSKPNPEIYEKALSTSNVAASQAIVVEDSINGIKAAAAASLYTIAIHADKSSALEAGAKEVVLDLAAAHCSIIKLATRSF